ncbi:hypothetical protein ACVIDN_007554 [Rhizobium brockwellii]
MVDVRSHCRANNSLLQRNTLVLALFPGFARPVLDWKTCAFQVHLVSSGLSLPALNQTVCAPRFFFGVTLGHGEIPERIAYARTPAKLPTILNGDEIVRFLEAVPSLRTRTH